MWNLKGYKQAYLQNRSRVRNDIHGYQGIRVGRDKLGDWD